MIKRFVAAAFCTLALSYSAHAVSDDFSMIGLWQGVDSVDGSLRTMAIADQDGDGVLEVLANDTFWSVCEGPHGLETVTGVVGDDGVLRTKGKIVCHSGATVDVETTFTPQEADVDMLLEEVAGQPFRTLLYRINR